MPIKCAKLIQLTPKALNYFAKERNNILMNTEKK